MKYKVIGPIECGYAWWNVIEPKSNVMRNFSVASFSIRCPNAEKEARELCARLNAK